MPESLSFDGLTLTVERPHTATAVRPPVLLVAGMFGGAWYWDRWQRVLASRGWTAYAIDLRGHYGSRPEPDVGRLSLRDYVADVLEVAARLEREHGAKPVIVGHSMGGLLAQAAAEAGAVQAAVLLCAAPPRGIVALSAGLAWRMMPHLWTLLASKPLTMSLADDEYLALNHVPAGERAAIHARMTRESGRAARELALGAVAIDARRVRVPMIVVTAGDDHFVPPRVGRALAQKYHVPQWHYEGRGHFLVYEPGTESIATEVEHWLAHVTTRAAQPAVDASLWAALKAHIGDEVELTFFDDYAVRAELVSVDLAARQQFVFEPREVRRTGTRASHRAPGGAGEVEWSPLVELVAVG